MRDTHWPHVTALDPADDGPSNPCLAEDAASASFLAHTYLDCLGQSLVPDTLDASSAARWLYESARFCLLVHNTAADPRFVYANLAAQACFERGWDDITRLPSRLTTEEPDQADRQRLIATVTKAGFATGLSRSADREVRPSLLDRERDDVAADESGWPRAGSGRRLLRMARRLGRQTLTDGTGEDPHERSAQGFVGFRARADGSNAAVRACVRRGWVRFIDGQEHLRRPQSDAGQRAAGVFPRPSGAVDEPDHGRCRTRPDRERFPQLHVQQPGRCLDTDVSGGRSGDQVGGQRLHRRGGGVLGGFSIPGPQTTARTRPCRRAADSAT